MSKLMLSYFDNFPEYNGQKIEIRGKDGYVSIRDISKALGKRFSNWTRTKFAKDVLEELSLQTRLPVAHAEGGRSQLSTRKVPLIDYVPGDQESIFAHPSVAFAYAMSDAKFFARISLWLTQLHTIGTVNPHIARWTREEYERGLQYNRDDIEDMYGKRR
jgi:KilA-N domain